MKQRLCYEKSLIKNDLAISQLGISLDASQENNTRFILDVGEKHLNGYGICHGGVIATLLDTAAGVTAGEQGTRPVTMSSTIKYMNPIYIKDKVVAIASIFDSYGNIRLCEAIAFIDGKNVTAATMIAKFKLVEGN